MNKLRSTQEILIGTSILAVSVILPLSQIGALTALAYSPASAPLSTPITAPESTPTPTPTPVSDNGNHDSDSHSDNGGGGNSGPSCNPEKPKSAPVLVSWEAIGKNQIRLHWSKAQDPVNYYLVNYGLKPHTPIYGNPNVGDQNTTSTVIGGLSGGTIYYFSVAAGHDCVHSDNSNEVAIKINGSKLNNPVLGFTSKDILSASTVAPKTQITQTPAVITNNQPEVSHSNSFFSNIANFFSNFFRH